MESEIEQFPSARTPKAGSLAIGDASQTRFSKSHDAGQALSPSKSGTSALSNLRFGVRLQFVSEVDVLGLFQDIRLSLCSTPLLPGGNSGANIRMVVRRLTITILGGRGQPLRRFLYIRYYRLWSRQNDGQECLVLRTYEPPVGYSLTLVQDWAVQRNSSSRRPQPCRRISPDRSPVVMSAAPISG